MKKDTIGILLTDGPNIGLTHDFFSRIMDSFKREVEKKGYFVNFLISDEKYLEKHSFLEQVSQRDYAGLFVANLRFDLPIVQELFDSGYPITCIDYTRDGIVGIFSDNETGIRSLITYVAKECGHKKIAYITGDLRGPVSRARLKAFKESCKEYDCLILPEYIRESTYRNMKMCGRITEELLALPVPPTCILYPDDYAAVGGINIIRNRGLEVPRDISYCGFDGVNMVSLFDPQITTIIQDTYSMGKIAAEKLIEMIENGTRGDGSYITVPTKLQTGATVKRIY